MMRCAKDGKGWQLMGETSNLAAPVHSDLRSVGLQVAVTIYFNRGHSPPIMAQSANALIKQTSSLLPQKAVSCHPCVYTMVHCQLMGRCPGHARGGNGYVQAYDKTELLIRAMSDPSDVKSWHGLARHRRSSPVEGIPGGLKSPIVAIGEARQDWSVLSVCGSLRNKAGSV